MIVQVIGPKEYHKSAKGNEGTKLPVSINGKKKYIYGNTVDDSLKDFYENLAIGSYIHVETTPNSFVNAEGRTIAYTDYKLGLDQSVVNNEATQSETVQKVFDGKVVKEKEELDGNNFLIYTKLMARCITGMAKELPADTFTCEDCRAAGISLFIFLTKTFEFKNTDINTAKWMPPTGNSPNDEGGEIYFPH